MMTYRARYFCRSVYGYIASPKDSLTGYSSVCWVLEMQAFSCVSRILNAIHAVFVDVNCDCSYEVLCNTEWVLLWKCVIGRNPTENVIAN